MTKKITLSTLFTIIMLVANAQRKDSVSIDISGKNELKANLIGLALGLPEISYERILKQKKGVGLSAFISPEKNTEYNFGIIPYFRWYLGKPKLLMFFVEGNMAAIYGEGNLFSNNGSSYVVKDMWGIGLGAAVGVKVLQRRSFVIEGFFGKGKALGATRSFRLYDRVGLTVGKAFN